MLYYANGGPGPATRLLRVHAPEDGDSWAWVCAAAERWTVNAGWSSEPDAQGMIKMSGEFFLIDESRQPAAHPLAALQHRQPLAGGQCLEFQPEHPVDRSVQRIESRRDRLPVDNRAPTHTVKLDRPTDKNAALRQ
jgi:hypothetical protein